MNKDGEKDLLNAMKNLDASWHGIQKSYFYSASAAELNFYMDLHIDSIVALRKALSERKDVVAPRTDWVKILDGGFPPPFDNVDIAYMESHVPLVSVGFISGREVWYDHLRAEYLNKDEVTHWRHRPKHPEE